MLNLKNITRPGFRKVPEITAIFWITKLATTAMGESSSDYLVAKINPYLAVLLGGILLLIGLVIQFKVDKYKPWTYWFCVAMVAVFGTMAADSLHKQLAVPYTVSTIFFAIALALIFYIWNKYEKTLSIHSINTERRELFYWATVLATFALGTAAGDLTANTFGLGYMSSIILFSGLIVIPIAGYYLFKLNEVIAFWSAYILTRPIGASIADWLGKPKIDGGLNINGALISLLLTFIIIGLVIYMTLDKNELSRERRKV